MSEAFVDLLYRGLPLGSRARMSQFDAHHAYVELPAPMPVGTLISIQAEGSPIAAHVIEIHEQTAGSERPPGMRVRPVLDAESKLAWWARASGDPSVTSRAPDAPVAAAEKPEPKIEAKIEAAEKPEPKLEAAEKPEPKLEAAEKPEPKLEAKPEPKIEAKIEPKLEPAIEAEPEPEPAAVSSDEVPEPPRLESPIISPRMARADTDVEEYRATEVMDAQPEPDGQPAAVAAELADEASGAVSAADLSESPDPPASTTDNSPRGRKKRRPNRR